MSRLFERINSGEVYVIVVMSANHGGSLENAMKIVHKAKEIGADCLKIQTYTADSITIDCDKKDFIVRGGLWDGYKLYDLYTDAGTPYEWQKTIKDECDKIGIDFLSTPFDNAAGDMLESIGADSYKIASYELVDIPSIEYAASKHKPMIISVGMGTAEEIQDAVDACHRMGNDEIVLLKCCSEYPANWTDMHLSNIEDMKKRFNVPIGLSDHSFGALATVIAVAMGACVVEKHMRLSDVDSPDVGFSMLPNDFEKMIKDIRDTTAIKGSVSYGCNGSENTMFRRSLFAVKDIRKGDKFTSENIRSIRPAPSEALAPKYYSKLMGQEAKRDIAFGEPLTEEDL